jgi:ketosteroid isomerase-like protein
MVRGTDSEQLSRMRSAIELWNAGDYEAVVRFAHPETVWRLDPVFPDLDTVYEGHNGLRRFFETFVEPWEDISIVLERVIDERPGQIYVQIKFNAKAREGMEVDVTFHQIYRLDDDNLITEFHAFADPEEARREAGLTDG